MRELAPRPIGKTAALPHHLGRVEQYPVARGGQPFGEFCIGGAYAGVLGEEADVLERASAHDRVPPVERDRVG